MKNIIVISLVLFLSACGLIPAKPKWPDVPPQLTERCPELNTVETEQLSVLLDTVVDNYSLYHNCAANVEYWNYWYSEQKRIYEEID